MWENRIEPTEAKAVAPKTGALQLHKLGHRSYVKANATGSKAYRPTLLQACREKQFSYEYVHGVTSFGAFTYSLAQIFRKACREARGHKRPRMLSWKELTALTALRLKQLGYDQAPVLVCPTARAKSPIPWDKKPGSGSR